MTDLYHDHKLSSLCRGPLTSAPGQEALSLSWAEQVEQASSTIPGCFRLRLSLARRQETAALPRNSPSYWAWALVLNPSRCHCGAATASLPVQIGTHIVLQIRLGNRRLRTRIKIQIP